MTDDKKQLIEKAKAQGVNIQFNDALFSSVIREIIDINEKAGKTIIYDYHVEDDGCYQNNRGHDILGHWVYAISDYQFADMECGTCHEATARDILDVMSSLRKGEA